VRENIDDLCYNNSASCKAPLWIEKSQGGFSMKKVFIVIGVLALCFAPLSLFADNEATDQGSLEFGLGPILSVYLYKGNLEGTTLIIGSGSTRFNFGYFITDNFSIGGFVYFASVKYEGYTESATEFGV
jgi:hypothetical protein